MSKETPQDPLEFVKNMWGNMGFSLPGMVTPTLDTDELGKRIADLKAVEGWLKSNLSLLQMTIQGLEMQRTTLSTLQHISQASQAQGGEAGNSNPFLNPAAWPMPWNLMAGATQPAPASEAPAPAQGQTTSSPQEGEPKR